MLMNRMMKIVLVKYIVMLSYTTNTHSQNLFKKLDGVAPKYEEREYQVLIATLNSVIEDDFV